MELAFLVFLGLVWGTVWHYLVPRDYWLVSIAAAFCASATLMGLVWLLYDVEGVATWILGASFALPATLIVGVPVRLRFRPRFRSGFCQKCGYSLVGLPLPRCPECGLAFEPNASQAMSPERPPAATALQVLYAIAFFFADALLCASLMFAGSEKLLDESGLWLWAVLGLSCAAVPCAGRAKTWPGVVAWAFGWLALTISLLVWWSRFA